MTMTMRVAANASSLSEAALQHLSKPARAIEMEGFFIKERDVGHFNFEYQDADDVRSRKVSEI